MSLSPVQISSHIKAKNFQVAEKAIIDFIEFNVVPTNQLVLAKPANSNPLVKMDLNIADDTVVIEQICNQYVTVISELFCHPSYKASTDIITCFLGFKFIVDWLFSASVWNNTDAIIEHKGLAKLDNDGQLRLSTKPQDLVLLMALVSLGSKFRLPWEKLFQVNPSIALSAYIGLISSQSIPALSRANNSGFNYFLESAKNLPILDLPVVEELGNLSYVFFNCSYATSPDKYEFKKWLVSLLRHNLQQWLDDEVKSYIANMPKYQQKEKVQIVVVLEKYSPTHSMFRCFNKILQMLSKNYQLVAFIGDNTPEITKLDIFDRVVSLTGLFDINENAKRIANERPDIILYPSIGMTFWGIYLSQLRLAPLQVMMGGHPSSSYSPEMDYFIFLGNSFSVPELQTFMSEKIITGDKPFKTVSTHTLLDILTPDFIDTHNGFIENDDEIKIGINGIITKVTYDVIELCKQIQRGTTKKVIFVFFSLHKSNQLGYLAAKKQLSTELKNFELTSFSDYLNYMKVTSECHFLLPTLPFGGSNSNIDAMVLKKPKIYLRGKAQIYTQCDQWEWERVDLDKELGCDSIDEIIKKSIHLIEDSVYRRKLHQLLVEKCTIDRVTGEGNEQQSQLNKVLLKILNQSVATTV